MLRDRKIAVFIDVDNTMLEFSQYESAMQQICAMGEIVCATVYGASERKQKQVIDSAKESGYTIQLPARSRKRVRKVFDDRIWVDATDLVAHNANVDTIAIVAYPTDMVYFFSYLRRLGLQVVGCNDLDEASLALVSDVVKLEKAEAAPKKQTAKKAVAKPTPAKQPVTPSVTASPNEEQTVALLREIEKLRSDYDEVKPAATVATAKKAPEQRASKLEQDLSAPFVTQGNNDLVRKIEEMRQSNAEEDSDDLVAEIKKLLDGLD